jgi:glycerate kinase
MNTESIPTSFECVVKYSAGAYVTSAVRGRRTSCTHSAEEAVLRLAEKVFSAPASRVQEISNAVAAGGVGPAVWRAYR